MNLINNLSVYKFYIEKEYIGLVNDVIKFGTILLSINILVFMSMITTNSVTLFQLPHNLMHN